MKFIYVYVAHKFSGELNNADRAEELTAYLNRHIEGAIFICPWVPMVRHWVDAGESRERAVRLDIEAVKHCNGLIVLSDVAGGVMDEWDVAKSRRRFSLTGDKDFDPLDLVQKWIDSLDTTTIAENNRNGVRDATADATAVVRDSGARDSGADVRETLRVPGWIRLGAQVWYHPHQSPHQSLRYAGVVDSQPFLCGSTLCVRLRDMDAEYRGLRRSRRSTVPAAAVHCLDLRGDWECAQDNPRDDIARLMLALDRNPLPAPSGGDQLPNDCARARGNSGGTGTPTGFSKSEIDDDLHPLTHDECRRRGIRHSSEDDYSMVEIRRDS